jgi:hypothetical protein
VSTEEEDFLSVKSAFDEKLIALGCKVVKIKPLFQKELQKLIILKQNGEIAIFDLVY